MALSQSQLQQFEVQIRNNSTGRVSTPTSKVISQKQIAEVLSQPKKQISVAPVKPIVANPTPSPVAIAKKNLNDVTGTVVQRVKDLGNGIKASLVAATEPKIISPIPQTPVQENKVVKITPTQKTIGKDQLQGIIGTVAQQFPQTTHIVDDLFKDPASLKSDPKKAINDAFKAIKEPFIEAFKRTYKADFNPSKTISGQVGEQVSKLTGDVNVLFSPLNAIFAAAEDVPVIASFAKLLTLPFVAIGEVAPKITNKLIDELPLTPESKANLKPAAAELLTLAASLVVGKAMEIGGKKVTGTIKGFGVDNFEKLTKTMIEDSGSSKTINLTADDVKKINLGVGPVYESDVVKSLGLSGDEWKKAVKEGLTIEVPKEKVVRIIDKPYWEKIKGFFNQEPTDRQVKTTAPPETIGSFAGYLNSGEYTPQEVAGVIVKNNLEATPEGKDLMKTVIEAQNAGQNIKIENTSERGVTEQNLTPAQKKLGSVMMGSVQEDIAKKANITLNTTQKSDVPGSELKPEQKPIGEGKVRESEAYKKVRARLEETTQQDVNYNRLNLAQDAENALNFITDKPQSALRVALGLEAPPTGQTETAISIALADKAGRDGNYLLQSQLESSRSLRQTRRGQEIVSERGRFNEDSPYTYIRELMDRRLKTIGKGYKSQIVDQFNKVSSAKKAAVEKIDRVARELADKLKSRDKEKIRLAQDVIDKLICK